MFCEVCGSQDLTEVLDLGHHPLCDDLKIAGSKEKSQTFKIVIDLCCVCKTAHQRYQVPKEDLFPRDYHYRSGMTQDVVNGVEDLINGIRSSYSTFDSNTTILDIGCNDGTLLDVASKLGAKTFGIEPTNAALEARTKGHTVYQEYLSEEGAQRFVDIHGCPDIVSFTNVFAHIEDLQSVLRSLRILLSGSQKQLLVIENHYLGQILNGNQFDTFYHEHPRTYSLNSFVFIAKTLQLDILDVDFPRRYGGNIRVYMGKITRPGKKEWDSILIQENDFASRFMQMRKFIDNWVDSRRRLISAMVEQYGEPIRAKAFPGRAAILLKMLELDSSKIRCIYEKDESPKVGFQAPGTDIPIVADNEFDFADNTPIINLAWHIPDEIKDYMRRRGFDSDIINIIE